jgi:hypothetical protein
LAAGIVAGVSVLSAWSATAATTAGRPATPQGTAAASNQPALSPGGAAGIKKAQGFQNDGYWWQAGLVIGAFVVVYLLAGIQDGDDDNATTTTGR